MRTITLDELKAKYPQRERTDEAKMGVKELADSLKPSAKKAIAALEEFLAHVAENGDVPDGYSILLDAIQKFDIRGPKLTVTAALVALKALPAYDRDGNLIGG